MTEDFMQKRPRPGRPIKSPELGLRVPICLKIPLKTKKDLHTLARKRGVSQSDIVVAAVAREAKKL